ncbi:MAG: CDGSH iron-sulfur domain-containing protein [Conexivisphaerales archaeon]
MTKPSERKIVVTRNGPFIVSGNVPLAIWSIIPGRDGISWEWKEGRSFDTEDEYALCRCGGSKEEPFCDGTHAKIKFNGKETASRFPFADQARIFDGPTLTLSDAEELCALARFCDAEGGIWRLTKKTDDPKARDLVIREANYCPAGRLAVQDRRTGKEIEEALPLSIGVIEDPGLSLSGPLWVRGGIRIESHNGKPYEVRNRVTLCRCGASMNKPLCDRAHVDIEFRDGLVEFEETK